MKRKPHPLAPSNKRDDYDTDFEFNTRHLPLQLVLGPIAVIVLFAILYELGLAGTQW